MVQFCVRARRQHQRSSAMPMHAAASRQSHTFTALAVLLESAHPPRIMRPVAPTAARVAELRDQLPALHRAAAEALNAADIVLVATGAGQQFSNALSNFFRAHAIQIAHFAVDRPCLATTACRHTGPHAQTVPPSDLASDIATCTYMQCSCN